MSYLDRIRACSRHDPTAYRPFCVGGDEVGFVQDEFAVALSHFPRVFAVDADRVRLSAELTTFDARTQAVADVLRRLADDGWIRGWRDEPYPVLAGDRRRVLFHMERAAVPRFGLLAFGVHLNGVVSRGEGLSMWIGRRSAHKHTAPLKLDQLVAGGMAAGHGVRETLLKEAQEEAGMPSELAARARPVGIVRYRTERDEGLRNDILFCYDIDLPEDFRPVNSDGELQEFYLWPLARVIETVRYTDEFKFNCALVIIHYLVRHGQIGPDDDDYLDIIDGLHGR